jgi:hypothetical protein
MQPTRHPWLRGGAVFTLSGLLMLSSVGAAAHASPTGRVAVSSRASHATPAVPLHSLAQLPAGLAPLVRHTLERAQAAAYAVRRGGRDYVTANPAQNLQVRFTAAGPRLIRAGTARTTWGLQLVGYGRGRLQPARAAQTIPAGLLAAPARAGLAPRAAPSNWGQQAELTASDGAQDDYFGLSVALAGDGSTALVGAEGKNGYTGAAYVFVRSGTNWTQQAELTASDAAQGDQFGWSVALAGDGGAALVGAPGHRTGVAYVFVRSGTTWTQQAELTPGDGAPYDAFGASVALAGDGGAALVGAPGRGAAYVFVRSGTTWAQQAELTPGYDAFGASVALAGDGSIALVGAPGPNIRTGAAYVFVRSGTTWTQQAVLTLGDGAQHDFFGASVALAGDGSIALVGAYGHNLGIGAAYVFVRSGTTWAQQAELTSGDGASGGYFGFTVALAGDGSTALVGAYGHNLGAYLFVRSGTNWTQQAELTAGDGAQGDYFGGSVAFAGDGSTALVGAPGHGSFTGAAYVLSSKGRATTTSVSCTIPVAVGNPTSCTVTVADNGSGTPSTPTGTVVNISAVGSGIFSNHSRCTLVAIGPSSAACLVTYIAERLGTSTVAAGYVGDAMHAGSTDSVQVTVVLAPPNKQQAELTASDRTLGDAFGRSAVLAGDGSTALVGACCNNTNTGAAYVFVHSGTTWTQQAELTPGDGAPGAWFGASVALAGDGSIALVGAPRPGAAYVFVRSGTTWTQQAVLTPGDGAQYDSFGASVALAGDGSTALVGAPGRGAAYVFVHSGTTWTQQAELTSGDGAQHDSFGASVALAGDGSIALVGAPGPNIRTGAAYVFVRSGTTWTQQAVLTPGDGAQYDSFGASVALAGDGSTALVGAPGHYIRTGAAYVFTRSGTSWTQQQELTAGDGAPDDSFGGSVALAGDGSTALVGGPQHYYGIGAAYIFVRSGTNWGQQAGLTPGDGAHHRSFGASVALAADGSTALVGAADRSDVYPPPGAAYVFSRVPRATGTSVRCTPNLVPAGTPTTCTTTVADTATGTLSTPSGTVSFGTSGSGLFGTGGTCTLAPAATTGMATCALTYTATHAGTDTITAAYGGDSAHATSSGSAQVTIVAGPPATLTLIPSGQTHTVNAQACLQAALTDRFGNAVPNSPVLFAVSGVNRALGSQSTNASGQAAFCYTGLLAGSDTVTAVTDPSGTDHPQPGEPRGTASVTWTLPASTPWCSVLMRGTITAADGDNVILTGLGTLQATGTPRGYVRYSDGGPAQRLSISATVQALVCNNAHTQAELYGTTPINGGGSYAYRVEVVIGPTGAATYSLLLSSGYSSGTQAVRNGAVRIAARLS